MKFIDWNNHGREERKRQNQELLDLNLKSGVALHDIITKIKESFFIAIFLQKREKRFDIRFGGGQIWNALLPPERSRPKLGFLWKAILHYCFPKVTNTNRKVIFGCEIFFRTNRNCEILLKCAINISTVCCGATAGQNVKISADQLQCLPSKSSSSQISSKVISRFTKKNLQSMETYCENAEYWRFLWDVITLQKILLIRWQSSDWSVKHFPHHSVGCPGAMVSNIVVRGWQGISLLMPQNTITPSKCSHYFRGWGDQTSSTKYFPDYFFII